MKKGGIWAAYRRGLVVGGVAGALYMAYVYWRAQMSPGDPVLNQYYRWARGQQAQNPFAE